MEKNKKNLIDHEDFESYTDDYDKISRESDLNKIFLKEKNNNSEIDINSIPNADVISNKNTVLLQAYVTKKDIEYLDAFCKKNGLKKSTAVRWIFKNFFRY